MLSDKELTDFSYLISARFEAVNTMYLKKMGQHINNIGKLSASDIRRLEQMMLMQQNIEEINKYLMHATNLSLQDLYKVYDISGMSAYGDTEKFYKANGKTQVPFSENIWIQNYLEAIKRQTKNTFLNISNTTSIQESYRDLVDTAITAVTSGTMDYNTAIRTQMSELASQGMRVQYASGITRRLDSAIRMNVLEGCKQITNMVRQQAGQEFGSDGVEISVHELCAPDHVDVQGKQFSNADFDKVQANLKRKISTCNCQHYIFPIVLGVSAPVNDAEELKQYKDLSTQLVTITTGYKKVGEDENGNAIYEPKTKTMTRYEVTQYQRNIESEVRKAKDVQIIAKASGDVDLENAAKLKIKSLKKTYNRISNEAGLKPRTDRMYVPGYNGKQIVPKSIKLNVTDISNNIEIDYKHTGILSGDSINEINKTIIKHTKETISNLNSQYPQILEYLSRRGTQFESINNKNYGIMSAVTSIDINGPYISKFVFANTNNNQDIYSSYKALKDFTRTKTNASAQWFMPCSENKLGEYLVSHEYGHIVQNYLMSLDDTIAWKSAKTAQDLTDLYNTACRRDYNILGKIIMDNKLADSWSDAVHQLSGYAAKRAGTDKVFSDVFAESFANMYCEKPNCWGKAMKIFLTQKGLL